MRLRSRRPFCSASCHPQFPAQPIPHFTRRASATGATAHAAPVGSKPRPLAGAAPAAAAAGEQPLPAKQQQQAAHEHQAAEWQLELELRRVRALTEAAGEAAGEGACARAARDELEAWAHERGVLSYGRARHWGGRLRQRHKAVLGQDLIRGSLLGAPPVASTARVAGAPSGCADPNGGSSGRARHHPPPAGAVIAVARGGCEADVTTGGGHVSLTHTRAFMRAWRSKKAQESARGAAELRAAVALSLEAAGQVAGQHGGLASGCGAGGVCGSGSDSGSSAESSSAGNRGRGRNSFGSSDSEADTPEVEPACALAEAAGDWSCGFGGGSGVESECAGVAARDSSAGCGNNVAASPARADPCTL